MSIGNRVLFEASHAQPRAAGRLCRSPAPTWAGGGLASTARSVTWTPLQEMDLPVYATGSTPGGPHKRGAGEVNVPIACGGISVHPGDIIVADADGIIVVPPEGCS